MKTKRTRGLFALLTAALVIFGLLPVNAGAMDLNQSEMALTTYGDSTETSDYQIVADSAVSADQGQTAESSLTENPIWTVTFAYDPVEPAEEIRGGSLTVQTEGTPVAPQEDTGGLVYQLPAGYDYIWEFHSANYAQQSGEIKLTDQNEAGSQSIFIPLTEITAGDSATDSEMEWVDIGTPEELLHLAQSDPAEVMAKNYRLTADIDLSGSDFGGIGTESAPFAGIFDGQGHTVSNMSVEGVDNVGFFGVVKGAVIKNLNLENANVRGSGENIGTLVGWAQAELDQENAEENTANFIGGCAVSGTISGTDMVGGLAGLIDSNEDPDTLFSVAFSIDKCTADAQVTGVGNGGNIGGLVGENNGVITKSAAMGDVTAENAYCVGGLAGDSSGDICDSYSEGNISGQSTVGGFVGSSSGIIKNSYSLGNVSGESYTGGFAGSIAMAENVVSAGQVMLTDSSTVGYNGGFAGHMSGCITGSEDQVTVKNAYANCTQADGSLIEIIGNTLDYDSEEQQAILDDMTLETSGETADKLYEMFGVNIKVSESLKTEAEKYAEITAISQNTGAISLLKENQTASEGIVVSYETSGDYLTGGDSLSIAKANDTAATLSVPVTIVLTEQASGAVYRREAYVLLSVTEEKRSALMDSIADSYTESKDSWSIMDMAVYETLDGKAYSVTEEAKQNVLNLLISEANSETATVSDRARIEIILKALGIDSSRLYPVNNNDAVDNAEILAEMDLTSGGYYAVPWLLLANMQGNLSLSEEQIQTLIGMLYDNMGDGLFEYTYDGISYSDTDTAGMSLAALASFKETDDRAKAVVDKVLSALSESINDAGSFGSANSDAMVIIGLLANGIEPADFKAASGASVVDGLLSYVNTTSNRFQYGGEDNELATEQGFRALVALSKAKQGAYNIYDFSENEGTPGRATGDGETQVPVGPGPGNPDIKVTVSIKADKGYWMEDKSVTVKKGSTVYHAFIKALEGSGITQVGAANGYVESMTKNGKTLSEFLKGPNSGWLYQVNSDSPDVGITTYKIEDGDAIEFYYSADWTEDSSFGGRGSSNSSGSKYTVTFDTQGGSLIEKVSVPKNTAAVRPDDPERDGYTFAGWFTDKECTHLYDFSEKVTANITLYAKWEKTSEEEHKLPFEDVKETDWFYEDVQYVYENGLFAGVSDNDFAPNETMTRAMLVTVLYRAEGEPELSSEMLGDPFADVNTENWYGNAVYWARLHGIVNGYSDEAFAPDDFITREQLAAILERYAEFKGIATDKTDDLARFKDSAEISDWARANVQWAVGAQLVNGRDDGRFDPQGCAVRAEVAAILHRFLEK